MFPYVPPQVQTPKEIETETKLIDDDSLLLKENSMRSMT